MTAEAEVMVAWALSKTGDIYRAQDPDRWIFDHVFDCSSLWVRSHRAAGVDVPQDVLNTVGIYEWALNIGALTSVDKAVATRGGGLLKGRTWGFGSKGHAAISLGDGNEMAAHGTRSGVHPGPVNRRFYDDGIILPPPMMHYADLDPLVDPKVLAALAALEKWKAALYRTPLHFHEPASYNIGILNLLLIRRAYLSPDDRSGNHYTQATRQAVKNFKRKERLVNRDGTVFGGPAAAALLGPH